MANFEMWLVGQGRKCWLRVTCNLDLGCILVVRWDNERVKPGLHTPLLESQCLGMKNSKSSVKWLRQ